jgi:hypothetical protein
VNPDFSYTHGHFRLANGSGPVTSISGVLGQTNVFYKADKALVKGNFHVGRVVIRIMTIVCRMLSGSFLGVAQTATTHLDYIRPSTPVLLMLFISQPAKMEKPAAASHGVFLMRGLCS